MKFPTYIETPITAILSGAIGELLKAMTCVLVVWLVGTLVGSLLGGGNGASFLFGGELWGFIFIFVAGGIYLIAGIPLYAWMLLMLFVLTHSDSTKNKVIMLFVELAGAIIVGFLVERLPL